MPIHRSHKLFIGLIIFLGIITALFTTGVTPRLYYHLKREGWIARHADLSELQGGNQVMIALALGQSNSANFGESHYTPHNRVLNYFNGKLYVASDPLVGADGNGGSVWGILGDMLIDSGLFKKVIIIPIGVKNTPVSSWAFAECHDKLINTLKDLDEHHIKLTHIFWHQGEADRRMATADSSYCNMLAIVIKTIRDHNQNAPFYCAIASYDPSYPPSTVANAQSRFIKANKNVLYGANTDTIISDIDRYQGVHFSESGMAKYAHSWFVAIKQGKEE